MGFYDRHVLPQLIDFACGMGAVMKALMPQVKGRADGRLVAQLVGERLA